MKNSYNHNFDGRFCDCDQIYDVDAEEGTMFQCLVCEDWFHEKCIGEGRIPDQDDFDVFVCRTCVGKNEWLGRYVADKEAFLSTLDTYPEVKVDIEKIDNPTTETVSAPSSTDDAKPATPVTEATSGVKRNLSAEPEESAPSPKRIKAEPDTSSHLCKWASLPPTPPLPFAIFLKEAFRNNLCRCLDCETTRLRTLPMISHEEETYEPDEDNSDTGTPSPTLNINY